MIDDYLRTFDSMFFDVEKHEPVKQIIDQVGSVLSSIITKYGEIQNEISYGISRNDDFTDTVICLFIRKIMEQLDAINVLYSVGSFTQAQVILRSMIENIISLKFILKEDTKKRAAAYYLEHHYKEMELGKKYFEKNSKYRKLAIKNNKEKINRDYENYKKKKNAFERIINSNEIFQQVDQDRKEKIEQKKKREKNKGYIQWYEVCSNISSFYGLMKETGYGRYYQGIYAVLSFETHALNSTMDMSINENGISLKYIRNPVDGSSTFSFACTFSISALIELYKYINDGAEEREEFKKFFIDFQKKRDIVIQNLDKIRNSTNN